MSSFSRRGLILSLAALPACTFTPVYGPASVLQGTVQIGAPDSANAFDLVRALELRLGSAARPRYMLDVQVQLTERGSVITQTQEIDRFSIAGEADYALATLDGAPVTSGAARGFTSYSASGTPIATRSAREDAQARLMVILADGIVARLATALAGAS